MFRSVVSIVILVSTDLEVEEVQKAKTLEELDVRENPLTIKSHDGLGKITNVRVTLTPRELEEWEEDLDV